MPWHGLNSTIMAKTLVVYYSRTGTTRKLAAALAGSLSADIVEIQCGRYGSGIFRYLRAGYDSLKGNLPPIEMSHEVTADYDLALIGAPIWTSYPALPLRAFLASKPTLPLRIGLFLTYGGHSPSEKAVGDVEALLGHPVEETLSLKNSEMRDDILTVAIGGFVERLGG